MAQVFALAAGRDSGWYPYVYVSVGGTVAPVQVKADRGQIATVTIQNFNTGALRSVKFFDSATAPVMGTTVPVGSYTISAATSATVMTTMNITLSPVQFQSGIWFAVTGAQALLDTTTVSAGDVFLNFLWQ